MGSKLRVTGCIFMAIYIFIYTPIILFFVFKFQRCRSRTAVRRRFPSLSLLVTLIACTWMISKGVEILVVWFNYESLNDLNIVTGIICYFLFALTFLWRYWLVHFELNYHSAKQDTKWWHVIDPTIKNIKSWYLNKKNTKYGRIKYTAKIWILSIIIILIMYIGSMLFGLGVLGFLFRMFLVTTPWIIMIVLYRKESSLNDLHDSIYIRLEQKYILYGFSIILFISALISITIITINSIPNDLDNRSTRRLSYALYGVFLNIFSLIILYICLIINYWSLRMNSINPFSSSRMISSGPIDGLNRKQIYIKDESKYGRKLEFSEMCDNKQKFEVLMDFCYREHNEENLYCLIEVIQFINLLYKYLKSLSNMYNADDLNCSVFDITVRFYSGMHKSSIVYNRYTLEIPKYLYTVKVIDVNNSSRGADIVLNKHIVRSINTHRPSNLTYARDEEPIRFKLIAYKLWEKYIKHKNESVDNMQINFVQQSIIDKLDKMFGRYGDYMRQKVTKDFMKNTLFHIFDEVIEKLQENLTNNIRSSNPDDLPPAFFEEH